MKRLDTVSRVCYHGVSREDLTRRRGLLEEKTVQQYELKLKSAKQEYWVHKISMGQNSDDGLQGDYYELGGRRWSQMARDRLLSLSKRDLDFAIGCLENYADAAYDNAERSDEQSALRLARALKNLKTSDED